jgi:transposase-like protein
VEKESIKEQVVMEYLRGGVTMRKLSEKYGFGFSTISRWVLAYPGNFFRLRKRWHRLF